VLLPLSLLFVGAVLLLNGLWMFGRIADREIIIVNFATAGLTGMVALLGMINPADLSEVRNSALTLLFTLTYLWFGVNRLTGADGRGLGWFSLFVSISVIPEAIRVLAAAAGPMDLWLGLCWVAWSGLWFMFFLTLALAMPLQRPTALATIASGVVTAWLPAIVLLYGTAT
jgi:putative amide transporter protein